jgi:hypothetical protein
VTSRISNRQLSGIEWGAKITWNSATGYQLDEGAALVNSIPLSWSVVVRSSLSLAANTLYNVYLYDNAGTPAIEESITAPVWNSTLLAYAKTGDVTRRFMGYICTDASGNIRRFIHSLTGGRVSEIILVDGSVTGKDIGGTGNVTTAWTSMDLSKFVPIPATHFYAIVKTIGTVANDDGVASISPIDLGAGVTANLGPFVVRCDNDLAGSSTFFGTTWFNISVPQTAYYRVLNVVGTGTVMVCHVHGSRFLR